MTDLTESDITPVLHTRWASGGEGSGRHSSFRSCKTYAGEDNHNYIFGGNRLISVKNDQGQVLFEEKSSSGKTELPHYLIPGKESNDLVERTIEKYIAEVRDVQENHVQINILNIPVKVIPKIDFFAK